MFIEILYSYVLGTGDRTEKYIKSSISTIITVYIVEILFSISRWIISNGSIKNCG